MIGFGNGITTNGESKLWAVDNQQRSVVEFDVDSVSGNLQYHSRIEMDSLIDNLHYEEETGNIMAAYIGRGIDFKNYISGVQKGQEVSPIHSGASYLMFKDGVFEQRKDLVLQDKIIKCERSSSLGEGKESQDIYGLMARP